MYRKIARLPFLVILMGIGSLAMLVPAVHAYVARDLHVAQSFFYSSLVLTILTSMIAVAVSARPAARPVRRHLLSLAGAFIVLPALLAVPFREALVDARFYDAYFEMVSSMTTTGATLYYGDDTLPRTLHLWRAMVAWLGGMLMWISAVAILAPLNLGGFEVVSVDHGASGRAALRKERGGDSRERVIRATWRLAPVYCGLTLLLWLILVAVGLPPLDGAVTAMSTLSTSGITLGADMHTALLPEFVVFAFLIFGISRVTFRNDGITREAGYLRRDPEIRLAAVIAVTVPALLFLRHWIGAFEYAAEENIRSAARALWGELFTTVSFLTTTGYESVAYMEARDWSGLGTPGLVLMGLSLIGGGVATTAGGVKLLRIYALYKHGTREMSRLIYPNSVGGSGDAVRRLRREGAFVAWIFFMLFALTVAVTMAALALAGQNFERASVLTIAALSTTGPLALYAAEVPILYAALSDTARGILMAAMVLGRLETLALIALFNRDFWRR